MAQKQSVVNFAWSFSKTLVNVLIWAWLWDRENHCLFLFISFLSLGKTPSYLKLINTHASNMSKRFPWRIHIQDVSCSSMTLHYCSTPLSTFWWIPPLWKRKIKMIFPMQHLASSCQEFYMRHWRYTWGCTAIIWQVP